MKKIQAKEYFIYCDESTEKGRYYSDFYGGVLVSSIDFDFVRIALESKKIELNLLKEIKWTRVTENYLAKYQSLMDLFFEFICQGKIKVRIMFRQEAFQAQNLTEYNKEHGYFLLYYQFVKHAFGLKHSNQTRKSVYLRIFFDEIPDRQQKAELFKNNIYALQSLPPFAEANLKIRRQDIGEIDSKEHVLLQCLDVVLGAMAFRLNDLHKEKSPETGKRGKRTKAKENLYKHILSKIRLVHANFNVGISTGDRGDIQNRWRDSYRHWNFKPRDHRIDGSKFK